MLKNLKIAGHIRPKKRSHNSTITECLTRVNSSRQMNRSAVRTPKTHENVTAGILVRSTGIFEADEDEELNRILQLSAPCENGW